MEAVRVVEALRWGGRGNDIIDGGGGIEMPVSHKSYDHAKHAEMYTFHTSHGRWREALLKGQGVRSNNWGRKEPMR